MKKNKIIGVAALAAMMGLSGCQLVDTGVCSHDWSDWEITDAPTCIDRGTRERTCYKCNKIQTRPISYDLTYGHDWVNDPTSDKKATCTEPGVTGSQYCTRCGAQKKGVATELGGHSFEVVENPSDEKYHDASCTKPGLKLKKCINCDATEEEIIQAKGHLAGTAQFDNGNKMGVVKCGRQGCNEVMAYELDIKDAEGFNTPGTRMSSKAGDNSKAVWDISSYIGSVIKEGSYDIQLEAAMGDASHGTRKLYNMARKDLAVEGDIEGNSTGGTPDKVTEDPYRYFVKVDSTTYYPSTKDSYADLGLEAGSGNFKYFTFLQGVSINKDTKVLQLIHGDITYYSLYVRSIRFIPHEHDIHPHEEPAENGRSGYLLDKCYCGYRYLTIDANDGTITNRDTSLPNSYVKLADDGDSATYTFNLDESITGSLYLVGKQAVANMSKNPYDFNVTCNDEAISFNKDGKVSSSFFSGSDVDMAGYSNEGRILIGEVTLKANANGGNNTLKITRDGEGCFALSQIVVEARPTGHIHDFVRDESKDVKATCKSDAKEYSYCSCGLEKFDPIPNTQEKHDFQPTGGREPTCTADGYIDYTCSKCGEYKFETVPAAHSMMTVTPQYGEALYELKRCSKNDGATEATWTLNQDMIKDNGVTTSISPISGTMSNNTPFTVFKFDAANRSVTLKYDTEGTKAVNATFSINATAKVDEISSTLAYRQEESASNKIDIYVNGNKVEYDSISLFKYLSNLGLKNVASNGKDGDSVLADPMWLDYYTINLKAGLNEIVINFPENSPHSLYIGGFRLSYTAAE